MKTLVTENNIQIQDSYKISKYEFSNIINQIKKDLPEHIVSKNRSTSSLKREWAVHNLLYNLDIARPQTKDVDFNYPLSTKEEIVYMLFGWICLLIIE